jgi:hypothetical protein
VATNDPLQTNTNTLKVLGFICLNNLCDFCIYVNVAYYDL